MADQDRIAPWFPEIPAAPGPSVRAPRPAARPGVPPRPSPPASFEAGRGGGDGLADLASPFPLADPAGPGSGVVDGGLADGPRGRGAAPAPGPVEGDARARAGEGDRPDRSAYLPALPPSPVPVSGLPGAAGAAGGPAAEDGPHDPRLAARRFAALLGDADRARGERDALARAGREDAEVAAERYRDAAGDVRDRVRDVWRQVAETLAPFGVTDLQQVRDHGPVPGALPGIGLDDDPAAQETKPRPALGRDGRRGQSTSPVPRRRRGGAELPQAAVGGAAGVAVAERGGEVSLPVELERARQLCLRALASSAELRGVQGASSSLSVGLVTAGGCLLVAVVVAVGRVLFNSTGLPCVLGALVVGGAIVSVGTEGGGAKAAVRSALLAAGTAGAVVLATLRIAPVEPLGIISSLLALAAAIRFGLGFGASKPEKPAAKGATGKRR